MRLALKVAVLAIVLAVAAAYVWLRPPERMALGAGSLDAFPAELDGWRSEDRQFDDVVYKELSADATLLRRYSRADGASVWLVIVYHENERYGAHDPVVCYTAQGWALRDQGTVTLAHEAGEFDVNWMVMAAGGEERMVLYWWYTAGDLATADRSEFMKRMAAAGMRSNTTFGAFVRVSTDIADRQYRPALVLAQEFAEAAQPEISRLFVAGGR